MLGLLNGKILYNLLFSLPPTCWWVLDICGSSFQPQIYGADRDTLGSRGSQGSPRPGLITRQCTDLEGLGAAREAECEGEGQCGSRWCLEGELLQEGCEEDEELGPRELLRGTSTLTCREGQKSLPPPVLAVIQEMFRIKGVWSLPHVFVEHY